MLRPEQVEKIIKQLKAGKRIVDLHPQQALVYDDLSKNRYVCAGSGWGKTFLLILIIIQCVFQKPGTTSVIISPTDKQGERNIYDMFKQIWDLLKTYDKYFKQFNTSENDAQFFANGEVIFKVPYKNRLVETKVLLMSGFNDARIRGVRITGILTLDELSFIDNVEKLWITLKGRKSGDAKMFAISTPPQYYDLLYRLIQEGQPLNEDGTVNKNKKKNSRSWVFKTIDNPTDDEIINQVKEAQEEMSIEDFEREFEGKWKTIGGNLCKNFKRENNIVKWEMFKDKPICFSSDFNLRPWTTIAFQILTKEEIIQRGLKINDNITYDNLQDEVMFVFKEWKILETTTLCSEFCQIASEWLLEINYDANKYELDWYGDPHGGARHVNSSRMANGKVSNSWSSVELYFPGVNLYNDKFEEQMNRVTNFNGKVRNYKGNVGILISAQCEELIKDIEQMRESANGKGIDKSREKSPHYLGHLFDCISYAVSYLWDINNENRTPEIISINRPIFQRNNINRFCI